jgi:AcrR family transcriptional regulator
VGERTYHHGDLRRALLDAAIEVIADAGPAALSLRDLARRAGVSHAGPTHHFRDKPGLLTALATEGFDLLAETLLAVTAISHAATTPTPHAATTPTPHAATTPTPHAPTTPTPHAPTTPTPHAPTTPIGGSLLELGVVYVQFAAEHRAHFEVMFRPDLYRAADPVLVQARQRAEQALRGSTSHVVGPDDGDRPDEVREAGVAVWALAHGFATLWLSGALSQAPGVDPATAARTLLGRLSKP